MVADESQRPNRGYAKELAQRGYVVIAPDYPSFGDSKNYNFEKDEYSSGTMKGISNHCRCIDYLQTLKEVDPKRIAVIGHSLGGHNAMFVAVFDERIKVIVSSCGWTPFGDYQGGNLTGWTSPRYMPIIRSQYHCDPTQMPFDFYEIVAALAPRVFFSNSPINDDNFEVQGVRKAINQASKIYTLYNSEKNLIVRYPKSGHDFPSKVRFEAYQAIDQAFKYQPRDHHPLIKIN